MSSRGQGSELVMAYPKSQVGGACIGRKLPSADKCAELNKKACTESCY